MEEITKKELHELKTKWDWALELWETLKRAQKRSVGNKIEITNAKLFIESWEREYKIMLEEQEIE